MSIYYFIECIYHSCLAAPLLTVFPKRKAALNVPVHPPKWLYLINSYRQISQSGVAVPKRFSFPQILTGTDKLPSKGFTNVPAENGNPPPTPRSHQHLWLAIFPTFTSLISDKMKKSNSGIVKSHYLGVEVGASTDFKQVKGESHAHSKWPSTIL